MLKWYNKANLNEKIMQKEPIKVTTEAVDTKPSKFVPCSDCKGTGLKDAATLCPTCSGGGQVLEG